MTDEQVDEYEALDLMLLGELIHSREERMVLRHINVRNAGAKKCTLQVLHLGPVNHLCVKVQAQTIDEALNVVERISARVFTQDFYRH